MEIDTFLVADIYIINGLFTDQKNWWKGKKSGGKEYSIEGPGTQV